MKKNLLLILAAVLLLTGCGESESPGNGDLKFVVTVPSPIGSKKILFGSEDYFVLTITGTQTRFESDAVSIKPRENFSYEIGSLEPLVVCQKVTVEAFYRNKSFDKREFEMKGWLDAFECKDGWNQVVNLIIPS